MSSSLLSGSVLNRPNEGLLVIDGDSFGVVEANETFLSATGYEWSDIVGKALPALSAGKIEGHADAERDRILREGVGEEGARFVFRVARKPQFGCILYLLPLADPDGAPTNGRSYLCFVNRDSRMEGGERIGVCLGALRCAMERVSDPMFIAETIPLSFQECNKGFERLTGWRAEELRGQSLRMIHRTDRMFQEFMSRRSRNTLDSDIYLGRWRLVKKKGGAITCAIIALDFFSVRPRKPVTLFLLLDRQEEEAKFVKLHRLAEEYRDLISGLERSVLPFPDADDEDSLQRPALTRRQSEIAGLVAQGYTSKEIASKLFISETTVRNHLSALFKRFGVLSRLTLVNELRKLGLLN